jgi:hypothetical protein
MYENGKMGGREIKENDRGGKEKKRLLIHYIKTIHLP